MEQRVGQSEPGGATPPAPTPPSGSAIALPTDLAAVEARLLERIASQSSAMAAAGAHIVCAGGKRLRSATLLLAAQLRGTYDLARTLPAATAVELIHAASLVHDDLVDRAELRRGRATVHARWDNDVALMLGDYFFALAASEMARCPDPRIITYYAEAVQTIVEGELHPVTAVEPFDQAMRQYRFKTGAKTATLFEAGCKAGMATGGGSDAEIAALGRYGYEYGLAFQIIDDVLDFIGTEQTLGKPAGNDLRQGTITLPLIYAATRSTNPLLRAITQTDDPTDAQVAQTIAEVVASGGIAHARAEAEAAIERAIGHLQALPETAARRGLEDLARFVLERHT